MIGHISNHSRVKALDMVMGQQLREIRRGMGVTQRDLADKLGITSQQIQKYEVGRNRIAASTLSQLGAALNFKEIRITAEGFELCH